MRYALLAMLAAFALVGAGLAWNGLALLLHLWWRGWELLELDGTVVAHERNAPGLAVRTSRGRRRRPVRTASYPVIRFETPEGEAVEFRSALGEFGPPVRYSVGRRVAVLYDPGGVLPPRLLTGASRWAEPATLILGGVAFLGAAGLIAGVYGGRIGLW